MNACNDGGFEMPLSNVTTLIPDAHAYWLNRLQIQWPGISSQAGHFHLYTSAHGQLDIAKGRRVSGTNHHYALQVLPSGLQPAIDGNFRFIGAGVALALPTENRQQLADVFRQQAVITLENAAGEVIDFTRLQQAGALDDLYAAATGVNDFGVKIDAGQTHIKLWAPTARQVAVCTYASGSSRADSVTTMQQNTQTGAWSAALAGDLSGHYYRYLVDVFVAGKGWVRNLVTDPYSISLTTDSRRSYIGDLSAPALKPANWDTQSIPDTVHHQTDMTVYELHVRDFSINDASVRPAYRGKYLAFTETGSNGMHHLSALRQAGLTDIHLLPVFDFATVPESTCLTPAIHGDATSDQQQAMIVANAAHDCFNWGYDPYHYNAPEGSYASNPADGAVRVMEFRKMVMALHQAGLRVGMDVVYNHTMASGQKQQSVLDRIVPGYYQRLDARGQVEQSTCCDNTATEHPMMRKLMADSVSLWAKQYKIDSFRFDLMGHQPRAAMQSLQDRLNSENGRTINLIGEGWNFGEIANSARFVQASQLSLNGSGIGTFSDRARDAIRGAGAGGAADSIIKNQGYINGLVYAPNALADKQRPLSDLLRAADMVRVGLAGSLRNFRMETWDGQRKTLQEIDYAGQPAGYVSQPSEVVNYVENHDNQTLFDINAYRLPTDTSHADRARVQILGLALTALSQGVAYFHAGSDILRSKSLDGNSFESGDWFNRLDWTYQDNYFATGLPPQSGNAQFYPYIRALLANPDIKPRHEDILMARDMFRDVLRIRASSSLFHLNSAEEIQRRLQFFNTGKHQNPLLIATKITGDHYPDANFHSVMSFINVAPTAQQLTIPSQSKQHFVLHPVHLSANAGDKRIASEAHYDEQSGTFYLPARSAVVFVEH
ncbi:MAG: DUF3372 domain-containing protein [Burkholderiales bacterium]|nr:DUF3372 domain-containing protein [Burkholderiales bacterium]